MSNSFLLKLLYMFDETPYNPSHEEPKVDQLPQNVGEDSDAVGLLRNDFDDAEPFEPAEPEETDELIGTSDTKGTVDATDTTDTPTNNEVASTATTLSREEQIQKAFAQFLEHLPTATAEELTTDIEIMSSFAPEMFLSQLEPITQRILELQDQAHEKALNDNGSKTTNDNSYWTTRNLGSHFSYNVGTALNMTQMQLDNHESSQALKSEYLERMFELQESDNPLHREFSRKFAHIAITLDAIKARQGEEFLNLQSRYFEKITNTLANTEEDTGRYHSVRLLDEFWADGMIPRSPFFIDLLQQTPQDNQEAFRKNFALLANYRGLENTLLDLQSKVRSGEIDMSLYERVVENLGYKNITHDLPALWAVLKDEFKKYKPNEQLHSYETSLISELDGNILDLGFGYGRHMNELKAQNKKVYGIDSAFAFAQDYKESQKDANVTVGDWQKLPFADNSMDNAYCLGRSILNNETPKQLQGFFKEANRVLKEGGELYVDTPTFDSAYYEKERSVLDENMRKAGISNYEPGALIDTPDGNSYTLRAFYEEAQFIANARLAGFRAERIEEVEYQTYDGSTNANVYWKLTKDSALYSEDQNIKTQEVLGDLRQSRRAQPTIDLINPLD